MARIEFSESYFVHPIDNPKEQLTLYHLHIEPDDVAFFRNLENRETGRIILTAWETGKVQSIGLWYVTYDSAIIKPWILELDSPIAWVKYLADATDNDSLSSVSGQWYPVFKNDVTDPAAKRFLYDRSIVQFSAATPQPMTGACIPLRPFETIVEAGILKAVMCAMEIDFDLTYPDDHDNDPDDDEVDELKPRLFELPFADEVEAVACEVIPATPPTKALKFDDVIRLMKIDPDSFAYKHTPDDCRKFTEFFDALFDESLASENKAVAHLRKKLNVTKSGAYALLECRREHGLKDRLMPFSRMNTGKPPSRY